MADEDEDDYLSMSFTEPTTKSVKETPLQRTARLKREAVGRGRTLSKAELAAKAEAARNVGFATKLDATTNKGAQLMAKMGFKGGALGAAGNQGRENPIEVMLRDGRGGIGMESEKKRKIREAGEAQESAQKKAKIDADGYRERNRQEAEDKRAEGQWWGAMKVLEGLEEVEAERLHPGDDTRASDALLRTINILYRPLIKDRREKDQKKRDLKSLFQDRPKLGSYEDPELDEDDKLAILDEDNTDLLEDDTELDEYQALPPTKRLSKVIDHLRKKHNYCFWCKYQYEDETLDGCPGTSEDEHG